MTILLKTDEDVEKLTDVADAVQATEEKVQVVGFDSESELVDGWLFGAYGRVKLWVDSTLSDEVAKYEGVTNPMTHPDNRVWFDNDSRRLTQHGRIARLKMQNIDDN